MKSKKMLDSFVVFCHEHPEYRFWQALRNWCGHSFVLVSSEHIPGLGAVDTFYWDDDSQRSLILNDTDVGYVNVNKVR